jgi:hypothetical protein
LWYLTKWILDFYYYNVSPRAYTKILWIEIILSLYRSDNARVKPKKGITRWFHKLRKNLYKNSIYIALLVHRQEYRNKLKENIYVYSIYSFSRT